jgi:hypothetical protein
MEQYVSVAETVHGTPLSVLTLPPRLTRFGHRGGGHPASPKTCDEYVTFTVHEPLQTDPPVVGREGVGDEDEQPPSKAAPAIRDRNARVLRRYR